MQNSRRTAPAHGTGNCDTSMSLHIRQKKHSFSECGYTQIIEIGAVVRGPTGLTGEHECDNRGEKKFPGLHNPLSPVQEGFLD